MTFLDLTDTQASSSEVLKAGTYLVKCDDATVKETKAGGKAINLKLKVEDGEHKGRIVFTSFNIQNSSAEAQRIGKEQLKTFMVCAGFTNPNKLDAVTDLVGKTVVIKTKVGKNSTTEEDVAEVKGFLPLTKAPKATTASSGTPF